MNIKKSLGIKGDELRPIIMLIGYSFFMGLSIAFFFTATISDFLQHYDNEALPYTYILSGVLGYLLWLLWRYFEKKFAFTSRLLIGISFLLITVMLLFVGLIYLEKGWLSFVMLVWVRVFVFVNMVNFWGMAGKLFNMSQGKRLFGLISIGTVISDIFGFLSIPVILLLGVNNLGLISISIGSLSVCLLITYLIIIRFREQLESEHIQPIVEKSVTKKREPFFKNSYQRSLFYLAILPMFGFYFVDFLFLDQVQVRFIETPEAIAGFMGKFFGVVALVELFIKTGVFNRLLYHFGLKVAIFILPIILVLSTSLAIGLGLVTWGEGMLFSAIAFTKLLEKALRSGINDPSFQILYQPIPLKERLAFQSKMEGVPSALGNIVAGGLILLLIKFGLNDSVIFNVIFIGVLAVWIYITYKAHLEYKGVIQSKLSNNKIETVGEEKPKGSIDRLIRQFKDAESTLVLKALQLLELIQKGFSIPHLKVLTGHKSESIRVEAKRLLGKYQVDNGQLSEKSSSLSNEEDHIIELLRSNLTSDKLEAIKLLKAFNEPVFVKKKVTELLLDDKHEVVHAAFSIFPKELDVYYAQFIIDNLESSSLNRVAIPILKEQGAMVEHLLIRKLMQYEAGQWYNIRQQLISLQIIQILQEIGSSESTDYLLRLVEFGNSEVKRFALDALVGLKYQSQEYDHSKFLQKIEQEAEYYTWILATVEDLSDEYDTYRDIIKTLKAEGRRTRNKLFSFLSFIYPPSTIEQIKSNLTSKETESIVMALEMCEIILSPTLKPMLNPIFMDVPRDEKLKLLTKEFPQRTLQPNERIKDIIYRDFSRVNTWMKILSMSYLEETEKVIPKEIYANIHINNPTIKEQAYLSMFSIQREEYVRKVVNESPDFKLYLDKIIGKPGLEKIDSTLTRVKKLKQLPYFKDLHEVILIKIAIELLRLTVDGDQIYCKNYPGHELIHFVTAGELIIEDGDGTNSGTYHVGDLFGLFDYVDLKTVRVKAEEQTEIHAIRKDYFFTLVSAYEELANSLIDHAFLEAEAV